MDERVAEAGVRAEPSPGRETPVADASDPVATASAPVSPAPDDSDEPEPDEADGLLGPMPQERERPSAPRRAMRWTRRDRAVAILVGVGLLIGVPLGLWLLTKIDTAKPTGTVTEIGTLPDSRSPAEAQPVQVVGAALPVAAAGASVDPAIGMPAPRISGYGFDGRPLAIDPAGGRKLVVIVSPDCDSCTVDLINLMSWREQGRTPDGLEVWTVSSGSKPGSANDPPSEWFKGKGWNFAVIADAADGAAAKAYGTSVFPTLLMIDQQGNVVNRMTGPVNLDRLDAALARYLPAG